MEEDHYVAEDFLHVLWLQQQLLNGGSDCKFCNQARILSLGTYPKYFNHREASNMVNFAHLDEWRHFLIGLFASGWSLALVFKQAQYGNGIQSFSMERLSAMCWNVLFCGRLQLGLVPTPRCTTVSAFVIRQSSQRERENEIHFGSFSLESSSNIPYRRMVRITLICCTSAVFKNNFCLSFIVEFITEKRIAPPTLQRYGKQKHR